MNDFLITYDLENGAHVKFKNSLKNKFGSNKVQPIELSTTIIVSYDGTVHDVVCEIEEMKEEEGFRFKIKLLVVQFFSETYVEI